MTDWYSRAREEDGRTDEEIMSEIEYKKCPNCGESQELCDALNTALAATRLEKVLPADWVWEAGNYPDGQFPYEKGGYWAQAISPEHGNVHSTLWGKGPTLADAIIDLKKRVIGWKNV